MGNSVFLDARHTAMVIIDVQQGLCEGADAAWQSSALIERLNTLADRARAAEASVIFVQHEGQNGYLEYGSRAWELADGLRSFATDMRCRKTTPDAFLRTELQALLDAHGVRELVIGGMHTEFCIDTTVRRALALGYPVVLAQDGHTSSGNAAITPEQVIAHHNATLTNISSFGPHACAVDCANISFTG